jgi:glycosyltransferase involved in cell wall biosynthesis
LARIRIVTSGQLGSNPRVVKEAEALAEFGHDVSVVSTKVTEFVEPRDQSILRAATWDVDRVRFDRPLDRKILRIRQELARSVFSCTGREELAELSFSHMTRRVGQEAASRPADLFIAHYVAALPAAAKAAALYKAHYAFDAEDFHLGDLSQRPEHEEERRLIRIIEERYLPGAAYITAASPGIAAAYVDAYNVKPPAVILNVFSRSEAPSATNSRGTVFPGPSIYWFSQTIGPERGLEYAVQAIGLTRTRPHLYLRGTPTGGYDDYLRSLSIDAGVDGRVHVLPPADPDEMIKLAVNHDIGYVGETGDTESRRIALTNKLFTYLLAGIPVVMSDIPAHRDLAPRLGRAARLYEAGNAKDLALAFDRLLAEPRVLASSRNEAWRLGQERYNWEAEKTIIQNLVSRICEETGGQKRFECTSRPNGAGSIDS